MADQGPPHPEDFESLMRRALGGTPAGEQAPAAPTPGGREPHRHPAPDPGPDPGPRAPTDDEPVIVMHLRDWLTINNYGKPAVVDEVENLTDTARYLVAHVQNRNGARPLLGAEIIELGGADAIRQRALQDQARVRFTVATSTEIAPALVFYGDNIATALAHYGTRAMLWRAFALEQVTAWVAGYAPTANTLAILPMDAFGPLHDRLVEFAHHLPEPGPWVNFLAELRPLPDPPWGHWIEDPTTPANQYLLRGQMPLTERERRDALVKIHQERYRARQSRKKARWWKKPW